MFDGIPNVGRKAKNYSLKKPWYHRDLLDNMPSNFGLKIR